MAVCVSYFCSVNLSISDLAALNPFPRFHLHDSMLTVHFPGEHVSIEAWLSGKGVSLRSRQVEVFTARVENDAAEQECSAR